VETSVVLEPELAVEPEGVPRLARRELVPLLAAAAALQAIAWVIVFQVFVAQKWGYVPWLGSDTAYYADRGLRVTFGQWPYTEFPFEYPPLSLLFFVLPPLRGTLAAYHAWFGAQMIVIDAITAIVTTVVATHIWPGLARPLAAAVALAVAVIAAGAVAIDRFDGAVALVLAVARLCLVYRRWALAGLVIGLGFSLKLMPIVLLPLVLVLARTRRRVVWTTVMALVAAAGPFLPFLIHDAAGVRSSLFGAQIGRGLHIESVAASPFLLLQVLRPGTVMIVPPSASLTISGSGTGLVESLAPLTVLLLLTVAYWAVWRARETLRSRPEGIPVAALAVVLAALCGNKVLSPQHLLWILPLVALCLVSRPLLPKVAAGLLLCACVLTQIEYPGMYWRQVDLDPTPLLVIAARNALLAAAFVVAVAAVWKLRPAEPGVCSSAADRAAIPSQVGPTG
jgi:hypothetical protein